MTLATLLGRARLLVVNDTGTSHLAAAVGLPSVVVFASRATRRWAPLDGRRHRALLPAEGDPAEPVAVERVIAAVGELLESCGERREGPGMNGAVAGRRGF